MRYLATAAISCMLILTAPSSRAAEADDVRQYLDAHPGLRGCATYQANPSSQALNDLVSRKLLSEVDRDRVFRGKLNVGSSECAVLAAHGLPFHIGPRTLNRFEDVEMQAGLLKGPFDVIYTLSAGQGMDLYAFIKDGKLVLMAGTIE